MKNCKFKKGLILGIVMLFVVTGIIPNTVRNVSASDTNLLSNSGFESGLSDWSTTKDSATWTTSSISHSGSNSVEGVEIYTGNLGRLYQDFTNRLIPGSQYNIGGWIKTENVQGAVVLALNYVNANGWSPADGYVEEIGYVSGTNEWSYYESGWFTLPPMPSDCKMLWFLFDFNNGNGKAWWDDVFLYGEARQPPTANAGDDVTAYVGDSISFDGTGTDTDGIIELYEWDFDGDGTYDWSSTTTGSTTHAYNNAGTYTATLRVTDNDDLTDMDTRKVKISGGIEKKALLIGCWDYQDDSKDLESPKNNIPNMENLLNYGFDFDDVDILWNPESLEDVNYSIIDLKSQTVDQDIKFVYYSGHGVQVKMRDKDVGNLIGVNEALNLSLGDRYYDYYLGSRLSDVNNLCAVFDTCFSGGLCNETDETEDWHPPYYDLNGMAGDSKVILMSSNSTQHSFGNPDSWWTFWKNEAYSYFTHYFIEAFTTNRDEANDTIPGDSSRVSLEEAFLYADEHVREHNPFTDEEGENVWVQPQIYDAWPKKENNASQFYLSDGPINDYWSSEAHSPVHLHAYDEQGRHVGLNDQESIDREIAGVYYSGPWVEEESIIVFNPESTSNIQIVVEAYDDGNFTLECKNYDKENQTTTKTFYENVSVINGSIASVAVDNGVFGNAEIDDNGDGVSDRTFSPMVIPAAGSERETSETPGFEIIFTICAIAFILLCKRNKKK